MEGRRNQRPIRKAAARTGWGVLWCAPQASHPARLFYHGNMSTDLPSERPMIRRFQQEEAAELLRQAMGAKGASKEKQS